ncbi:Uncharacterised protein [Shewanella putrefaciens]|nr:Uncharacterised protein [Shewanella putrefaciens]
MQSKARRVNLYKRAIPSKNACQSCYLAAFAYVSLMPALSPQLILVILLANI